MESPQYHILVCGTAMWLLGIADLLDQTPNLRVTYNTSQNVPAWEATTRPDLILVERGAWDGHGCLSLSDVPIIEIDGAQSELLVRSARRVTVADIADLTELIQQIIRPDGE